MSRKQAKVEPIAASVIVAPQKPELYEAPSELRLDLGAGQSPREGFESVDLHAPDAKHRVDLFKFPFPWEDNSVSELHASHFIEHLPAREVELRDVVADANQFIGQDFLFAFFDECWRILKPGGLLTVIVPAATSTRAFQDPTHRRFIPAEAFLYLNREWRKVNQLDHYRVRCHFEGADPNVNAIQPAILPELSVRHDEVQATAVRHWWNAVLDWRAILRAVKT
jgi:hypothetical protein